MHPNMHEKKDKSLKADEDAQTEGHMKTIVQIINIVPNLELF